MYEFRERCFPICLTKLIVSSVPARQQQSEINLSIMAIFLKSFLVPAYKVQSGPGGQWPPETQPREASDWRYTEILYIQYTEILYVQCTETLYIQYTETLYIQYTETLYIQYTKTLYIQYTDTCIYNTFFCSL